MTQRFRDRATYEAFRLGDEWPDWWANAVSANIAVTHNVDGRWRGGPDYADIETLHGQVRANRGDWIIQGPDNHLFVCGADAFARYYEAV